MLVAGTTSSTPPLAIIALAKAAKYDIFAA
jgi:hypothetical protein